MATGILALDASTAELNGIDMQQTILPTAQDQFHIGKTSAKHGKVFKNV